MMIETWRLTVKITCRCTTQRRVNSNDCLFIHLKAQRRSSNNSAILAAFKCCGVDIDHRCRKHRLKKMTSQEAVLQASSREVPMTQNLYVVLAKESRRATPRVFR